MLDVIDGAASIGELAVDVHEAVGVPLEDAQRQVLESSSSSRDAGLLSLVGADLDRVDGAHPRDLFLSPPTPCAENASRLGTVTLNLQLARRRCVSHATPGGGRAD